MRASFSLFGDRSRLNPSETHPTAVSATPSSKPPARLGECSSPAPKQSPPSECPIGRTSIRRHECSYSIGKCLRFANASARGMQFESPLLHQEVNTSGGDFPGHRNSPSSRFTRSPTIWATSCEHWRRPSRSSLLRLNDYGAYPAGDGGHPAEWISSAFESPAGLVIVIVRDESTVRGVALLTDQTRERDNAGKVGASTTGYPSERRSQR